LIDVRHIIVGDDEWYCAAVRASAMDDFYTMQATLIIKLKLAFDIFAHCFFCGAVIALATQHNTAHPIALSSFS
jgi:hypothetical protein